MKSKQLTAVSGVLVYLLASAPAPARAEGPLRVDLVHLSGFSKSSQTKVEKAVDLMELVLNSAEFRQAVLDFTYDGKKEFVHSGGLTNEQVYAKIMAAREIYLTSEDNVAALDLHLYTPPFWKKWSVVGYGYEGKPEIYMNWYYFNSYDLAEIAGNLTHEWLHKIGFEHDYNRTARRPYSVPYAVGNLMVQMATRRL